MIQAFLGPIANLASTWLNSKVETKAAETRMKVSEADAKAQIMVSAATSQADWERIMAQGTTSSIKDEIVTICVLAPVVLCFIPGLEATVKNGFQRLSELPDWYTYLVYIVCCAAIGIRGGKQFFGKK